MVEVAAVQLVVARSAEGGVVQLVVARPAEGGAAPRVAQRMRRRWRNRSIDT